MQALVAELEKRGYQGLQHFNELKASLVLIALEKDEDVMDEGGRLVLRSQYQV
jgi:hypothetical protein